MGNVFQWNMMFLISKMSSGNYMKTKIILTPFLI